MLIHTAASTAGMLPVAMIDWATPPTADRPILVILDLSAVLAQLKKAYFLTKHRQASSCSQIFHP